MNLTIHIAITLRVMQTSHAIILENNSTSITLLGKQSQAFVRKKKLAVRTKT